MPIDMDRRRLIESEANKVGEVYKKLDLNGDNSLTKRELVQGLKKREDEMRSSKNRMILKEFYDSLVERFNEMDKNDDNRISFIEFMQYVNKAKDEYNK